MDSILIKTPIVFAGVNMLLRDSLEKYPLMTGFEARIDLVRNIELLTKMDNKQAMMIELDEGPYDDRLREQLYQALDDSLRFLNNSNFYLRNFENEFLRGEYAGKAVVNFISCAKPQMNRSPDEPEAAGKSRTERIYQKAGTMRHLQVKNDIYSNSLIKYSGKPQFTTIREQFNNPDNVLFLCGYFTGTDIQVRDQVEYAVRILQGEVPKILPILAICYKERLVRQLALSYGVTPIYQEEKEDTRHYFFAALKMLIENGYLKFSDKVAYLSGSQNIGGGTTFLEINSIDNIFSNQKEYLLPNF